MNLLIDDDDTSGFVLVARASPVVGFPRARAATSLERLQNSLAVWNTTRYTI